jgi:hypothetical protein
MTDAADDFDALFEEVAAQRASAPAAAPTPAPAPEPATGGDSGDTALAEDLPTATTLIHSSQFIPSA